ADNRTMFMFYAVAMVPFMILAIVLAAGLIIGRAVAGVAAHRSVPSRRAVGATLVGGFMFLVLINFWWLYPVLAAEVIPHSQWWARMLFPRWV
ncbi:phospholipid carrier-dependent glycosyltransferase, partial [Streptosporangium sp. NPDC004631]